MNPMYREHRRRALEALRGRAAAALIPTATHKIRNFDAEFRFRPDSDFWWLSGFGEPDSVLLLLPAIRSDAHDRSVLFLREKKRDEEIWSGRRLGIDAAKETLGVDEAFPIGELWTKLPDLLKGYRRVVYRSALDEARDRQFQQVLAKLRMQTRIAEAVPLEVLDPAPILHELRLFKSPAELATMRRAAAITAEAHAEALRRARPGVNERELDALLQYEFLRHGANGPAYTNIVAGGRNACILHYVENDQPLRDGDLLLIDAGAEVDCYACDVTRTFPINGRFSREQRALYDVVLAAQLAAIASVGPKLAFTAAHEAALRVLTAGLIEHGLLKGSLDDALKNETYKRFYMHRTGHWLGLDVHDCGAYVVDGAPRTLEAGMVVTVEPGLYVAEDDDTVEPRWRGIGIRIEDDVLVTPTGNEVLTRAIAKDPAELERLRERGQPVGAR
ncbi:MAG: aminopeptidase P N-terminal domain-containing protein [Planctomycetes bacterium]|nr:aminopeptidase P N-terminal domain-containing protein [Planctomycetota bacterium]